jgi:CRISPR-associated protein Csb2
MPHALVIRIRFHDGRYHGAGDWPPSPARLFQALVAAAGLNGRLAAERDSLRWLEELPAPIIAAPNARRGQRVMLYMPNNDLDAVQGDPRRTAEIRTAKKLFSPWLFEAATPLLYLWQHVAGAEERHAQAIASLAEHLYQLGRGIDMAWAWGELLEASGVDDMLASYPGPVHRPSAGGGGVALPCPRPGSLISLEERYREYRRRFAVKRKGSTVKLTFRQPPPASFRTVTYESPPFRRVYELPAGR